MKMLGIYAKTFRIATLTDTAGAATAEPRRQTAASRLAFWHRLPAGRGAAEAGARRPAT